MGIILSTAASIVVLTATGVAISTMFTWLHEYEFNNSNKLSRRESRIAKEVFDYDRFNVGKGTRRGN